MSLSFFAWRQSGTQGALTGVGLSIGYPTKLDSSVGLVVMSSAPGGPANKAGIIPGDIILAIDNRSTEDMDIYDAAELLQWELYLTSRVSLICLNGYIWFDAYDFSAGT